jgi:hypothetical protein
MKFTATIFFLIFFGLVLTYAQSDTAIYDSVDVMPRWIGCENLDEDSARECFWEGLSKFVTDRIIYPKYAKENGYQGSLYVQLIVEKNGVVSSHKILRGIGGGTEEEALRIAKQITNLKPGMRNGALARVQLRFKIYFVLRYGTQPKILIGPSDK